MNGAEALIKTLARSGVTACFTNPGTSEMHFVAALDRVAEMRAVLCLFEGVATGAADGYGRMAGRPASTLLHLGPGLGNGLANLHNARRARTPVVNIVGDHATYHRHLDAPLTSDIEGFAKPVSKWIRTTTSAGAVGDDAASAVEAAMTPVAGIATLILPADVAWTEGGIETTARAVPRPAAPHGDAVVAAARALKAAKKPALLLSGGALRAKGLEAAARVAAATGATVYCDTFAQRLERGAGRHAPVRLPYFGEQVSELLQGVDLIVLVETKAPVSFFAYPGKPSELAPKDAAVLRLASEAEDGTLALLALGDELGAKAAPPAPGLARPDLPKGGLTVGTAGAVIAALLPENAIVVDEAATSGTAAYPLCAGAPPHDWLFLTGGSIGMGLPLAVGAAVACPDRKTVCLHGDGGAMYTVQALWTQARERLDVTNIIFNNRAYAILNFELMRVGAQNAGPKALSMLDLTRPSVDWVKMGEAQGVSSVRADTAEGFAGAFERAMRTPGPHLIEVVL